jgi:O-antigen ligase
MTIGARVRALGDRIGWWALCALVLATPFLVSPTAEDAFRLVKLAGAETLALVSLLALCAGWWHRGSLELGDLSRASGVRIAGLLLLAAAPGVLFLATHPLLTRRAAVSFTIALACLAVWSVRLDRQRLRRALDLATIPAVALAGLAILQAHDVFSPFAFAEGQGRQRYGLTSLAGSVGDLAAYLVLPALLLQAGIARSTTRGRRVVRVLLLAVVVYALLVSQTLAALAAVGVGSLLFWALALPPRRRFWAAAPVAAIVVAALLVPGLERRVDRKLDQLRGREVNALLSGRLDGWKAGLAMVRERPWFGVGHGAYRAHFAEAKLELLERGESFYSRGRSAHFANAHNDYVEALAEWGAWGATAAALALVLAARRWRELWRVAPPPERGLVAGGGAAIATLASASFPFHLALTAYPWILFAAWLSADEDAAEIDATPSERAARGGAHRPREARSRGAKERGRAAAKAAAGGAAAAAHDAASPQRPSRSGRATVPAWTIAAASTVVLAPALVVHGRSLGGRLEASRVVRTTTQVAQLAMQSGTMGARPVLQANLRPLHRAEELDPVEVGVPLAIGSHYLLLDNAPSARDAYERAFAREPRPNLYLNLARVLLLEGRRDEAMAAAGDAVALDPALRDDAESLGWTADAADAIRRSER